MSKIRMNIQGHVQGVGFRFMTKILAERIGVFGIVRNEADGSVYLEANGADELIEDFIQQIKNSPSPSGKVTNYTLDYDSTIEERKTFKVV
ncbi:acylphosphatase [Vagococcus entomophilus]|uniref:acylphosphatase n=1 Tax=Vagococcus entomophilus TaxID=1160095 RepID=A0A430AIN8_9ENTE|nr:acylphosphatase [Vagococcus entomophilus]RSU07955.1 acylphosphatase [Vagococcus entomophilus]